MPKPSCMAWQENVERVQGKVFVSFMFVVPFGVDSKRTINIL